MRKPNGYTLYDGPSAIDGERIIVVILGFSRASENSKTGALLQTYILRADADPVTTANAGHDTSICGSCPHRSLASGGAGSCYVNLGQGPRQVFLAWQRGNYPAIPLLTAASIVAEHGAGVRVGSYGDPAAVPDAAEFWGILTAGAPARAGYTHRWRDVGAGLVRLVMASVDSPSQALEAQAAGWSTFRVTSLGDGERMRGEARCPASVEAGKRVTCAGCPMKCDGKIRPGNVGRVIQAHGKTKKRIKKAA